MAVNLFLILLTNSTLIANTSEMSREVPTTSIIISSNTSTSEKTSPQPLTTSEHKSSSTEGPKTTFVSENLVTSTMESTSTPRCDALPVEDSNVCRTGQCYATAGRLLSLMNATVDPCEDFYHYACGGIDNPTLLANDLSIDVWQRMERAVKNISPVSPIAHKKFKTYYEGCVNYDDLVSMEERKKQGKEILDSIGTFLRLGDDDLAPTIITDLLIKLFKHGSAPLFEILLDVDSTNSSKFQVVIVPTPISFSGSHFFTAVEKNKRCHHKAGDHINFNTNEVYGKYLECLDDISGFLNDTRRALRFFGLFDDMLEDDTNKLIQDISISIPLEIFNVKKGFTAKEFMNATQFKDSKHTTKKVLGDQSNSDYISEINWDSLFSNLLNISASEDIPVQVYFHKKIQEMFIGVDIPSRQRHMHNALLAVFAHDLYQGLVARTHTSKPERERYCLGVAASLMPEVAANLYMATFPSRSVKDLRYQVLVVYMKLVAAIEENLKRTHWMDDPTLWDVRSKVTSMSVRWPETFNETLIARNLEKCPLDKRHYLEDSVCLVKLFQEQLYSRFYMDPHSADAMWVHFSTPFSTETTFVHGLNSYMVPLAVMSPVYDREMPDHVKAARLGNLLGRGLGHSFDRTGVKFSSTGKMGHMLSEYSNPPYVQVVEDLLSDGLSTIVEDGQSHTYKPDPTLTLNRRLSDITAANLSLAIVKDSDTTLPWVPFPSKQVYFIALAQEFCSKKTIPELIPSIFEGYLLPRHRVENIVRNSEQFGQAFNCPEGSPMNKAHDTKAKPFPLYNEDRDIYFVRLG